MLNKQGLLSQLLLYNHLKQTALTTRDVYRTGTFWDRLLIGQYQGTIKTFFFFFFLDFKKKKKKNYRLLTWMVFVCLANSNDYKLNNLRDVTETKPGAAAFNVSQAANFTLLQQSNTPLSYSFTLCAHTPSVWWCCSPRISTGYCPLRYGSDPVLVRRPVTPTGCIKVSPPRCNTVDSWRREAEEFPR